MQKDPQITQKLSTLAFESVVKGIDWDSLDILITTPI